MTRYVYEVKLIRHLAPETAVFEIEVEHDADDDIGLQDEVERVALDYAECNDVDWEPTDVPFDIEVTNAIELEAT
jgi:hypothetical protein